MVSGIYRDPNRMRLVENREHAELRDGRRRNLGEGEASKMFGFHRHHGLLYIYILVPIRRLGLVVWKDPPQDI